MALATIPYFVCFQFEIYRIVLSPLVNTHLFTLLFAFLSFLQLGKRLEYSMGTVAFGWFCGGVALLANTGFLVFCVLIYAMTREKGYLMASASGVWLILFGAIAAECVQAPAEMKRRFFFCEVPVRYYPVALFALFSFFGGGLSSIAYAISVGVGYLFGQGRLDHILKLSGGKAQEWENGVLAKWASRPGWVVDHAAIGSDAWSQVPTSEMGMMGSSFFRPAQVPATDGSVDSRGGTPSVGSIIMPGNRNASSSNAESSFVGSSGHTLGGGTANRRVTDARAARLQALERRGEHAV